MKKIYTITILSLLAILYSCNKYLDVRPQGTLVDQEMFKDAQGYKDAMNGAYAAMALNALYGENLSFGFIDKLGQLFMYNNVENNDYTISQYKYLDQKVRPKVDQIFSTAYTTISYFNNIIEHCENDNLNFADKNLILAEAYGARAMIHFDMARLFCPKYIQGSKQAGLPYSTEYNLNNKPYYNLDDFYKKILEDLDKAEKLLENDNMIWNRSIEDNFSQAYTSERYTHINKFAIYALKARIYYTMSDNSNAAKYAKMIIDNKDNFKLVDKDNYARVYRFPSEKELIFGLQTTALNDTYVSLFLDSQGLGNYTQGRDDIEAIYETKDFTATSTDLRFNLFYIYNNQDIRFTRFLFSEAEAKSNPIRGISIIRLPEMYYILSESLYDSDKTESIRLLNEVRHSRGLGDVAEDKINDKKSYIKEMLRERMRELPGEGQVFYALKMYNIPFTSAVGAKTIEASDNIFILPLPEAQIEFGSKQ